VTCDIYVRHGEEKDHAKLTDAIVLEMRAEYVPGSRTYGASALARNHKVSHMVAWNAIHGYTWNHLPGARSDYYRRDT
jgi:hypothetical protein